MELTQFHKNSLTCESKRIKMKKLLMFLFASGLVFSSCSNDDDEQNEEFSLVGVWHPAREIVMSGSNGITLTNTDYSPCYRTSTFDFKTNNTVVSNIFENNISGNCVSTGIDTAPYSYDHVANKLIIDGETTEIVSRTENEFQIVSDFEDRDGDGIDDKIIFVMIK